MREVAKDKGKCGNEAEAPETSQIVPRHSNMSPVRERAVPSTFRAHRNEIGENDTEELDDSPKHFGEVGVERGFPSDGRQVAKRRGIDQVEIEELIDRRGVRCIGAQLR